MSQPQAELAAQPTMLLWGTIGYAAYLCADGSVWLEYESPDGPDDHFVFRQASPAEAMGVVVMASSRHPEFASLVPPRPVGALDCTTCNGRGTVSFGPVSLWCGDCYALGWRRGDSG